MLAKYFTPSFVISLALILLMASFSLLGTNVESLLEFNRSNIQAGEYWRLLTGNLVHFGSYHLLMNLAAFILISWTLLRELALKSYIVLLALAALMINLGILWFTPELEIYRGFSGILHGLLVAGLLLNNFRNKWLSYACVLLVFAKIIHEHSAGFEANQLQSLLPVKVAVDSHLYGAIAGLVFIIGYYSKRYLQRKKSIA
ncbi:MAG TPA: rhombosortase [Cellvibrio sp.]|nr:rhombosortase [Cellvibrio sp.]